MNRDSAAEFERLRQVLLSRYYRSSIIQDALVTRDYDPNIDNTKEFRQIGTSVEFETDVFADSTHYLDMFFEQTADNIVLGEKKYVVDTTLEKATTLKQMNSFTYENLVDLITTRFHTAEPSLIFMPLTLFTRIHLEWMIPPRQNKVTFEDGSPYRMVIPSYNHNPQLVWSNKYMPFDNIVVVSKQFGEWIAKPRVNDRVKVTRSDTTGLHVYSIFHFVLGDPQQALKIEVNANELDKERLDELTRPSA